MPLMTCSIDGISGYKWGESGTCYTGPQARQKALAQGAAIHVSKSVYLEDIALKEFCELHNVTGSELLAALDDDSQTKTHPGTSRVVKTVDDKNLVFGFANVCLGTDGEHPLDWDGDVTDPSDLEDAAYNFVLKYRKTGTEHKGEAVGDLVESAMLTKEKQAAMGIPEGAVPEAWWVGFKIADNEIFKKVKSGEYEMFSVQGSAVRNPL